MISTENKPEGGCAFCNLCEECKLKKYLEMSALRRRKESRRKPIQQYVAPKTIIELSTASESEGESPKKKKRKPRKRQNNKKKKMTEDETVEGTLV